MFNEGTRIEIPVEQIKDMIANTRHHSPTIRIVANYLNTEIGVEMWVDITHNENWWQQILTMVIKKIAKNLSVYEITTEQESKQQMFAIAT